MPDEEKDNMDELIREASNAYHPAYDDNAWDKMEALLDKHLPLVRQRKRPVIFFLLLLFIAGVVFFVILFPWDKKEAMSGAATETEPAVTSFQQPDENARPGDPGLTSRRSKSNRNISTEFLQGSNENDTRKNLKKALPLNRFTTKRGIIKTSGSDAINDFADDKDIVIKNDKALPERDEQVANDGKILMPVFSAGRPKDQLVNTSIQNQKNDSTGIKANSFVINETATPVLKQVPNKSPEKKKRKNGFANSFAITLSAGPDRSFVDLEDPGKTKLNYGAGLSYTFANRVTVSGGFYMAKKIYSAKPADYHPPRGYWTYNINLQKVEADCNVYEIPLAASYKFNRSKNHNWLAGIGFSTFLMKSETYEYLYKNQQGQDVYRSWTLLNRNKHYFSVLTISGGYQYRFNNHFSMIAEPYLKLPLRGIGFGKIKLNSGGLLITASIQPFAKRK